MRWRSFDPESTSAAWIGYPLLIVTAPVWLALIALLWLDREFSRRFGPKDEWTPWFAWHPVHTFAWDAEPRENTVWFERVWRRKVYGRTEYQIEAPSVLGEQGETK